MNAIILFGSTQKLTPQHQPVTVIPLAENDDLVLYVRPVRVSGENLSAAIAQNPVASPQPGEKAIGSFQLDGVDLGQVNDVTGSRIPAGK